MPAFFLSGLPSQFPAKPEYNPQCTNIPNRASRHQDIRASRCSRLSPGTPPIDSGFTSSSAPSPHPNPAPVTAHTAIHPSQLRIQTGFMFIQKPERTLPSGSFTDHHPPLIPPFSKPGGPCPSAQFRANRPKDRILFGRTDFSCIRKISVETHVQAASNSGPDRLLPTTPAITSIQEPTSHPPSSTHGRQIRIR